jgi:aryl-alcohol dehydrogenase-like predicted oxidoreductase
VRDALTGFEPVDLGFGAYRVEGAVGEHHKALETYLERGGNVIDTAANYTAGHSERLVGEVLAARPSARVLLVTKAGYLEPLVEGRCEDGLRADQPEVVPTPYGFSHCIHPAFLQAALERSLRRLRRERVDLFLLHNPEYFLSAAMQGRHRADPAVRAECRGQLDTPRSSPRGYADVRAEFRRRVGAAFEWAERQVAAGRMAGYGVSSNHLGRPAGDPEAVTVQELLEAARGVSSNPSFKALQCPLNLLERGPALPLGPGLPSVLEAASQAGLAVLTNRPLSAFRGVQVLLRDGHGSDLRAELYLDSLKRSLAASAYDRLDRWGLTHAALDLVRSLPGVTCALNGMRRPAYVRIAFEVLAQPRFPRALEVVRGLY